MKIRLIIEEDILYFILIETKSLSLFIFRLLNVYYKFIYIYIIGFIYIFFFIINRYNDITLLFKKILIS